MSSRSPTDQAEGPRIATWVNTLIGSAEWHSRTSEPFDLSFESPGELVPAFDEQRGRLQANNCSRAAR